MDLESLFNGLSIDDLNRYVAEAHEENLRLEFKTVSTSDLSTKDDKKNLARAISGFANSDGGMVIWGVDARKNEDGVDCARRLAPIAQVERLLPRLNELTGEAVSPVVDGVEHRIIFRDPNGHGFAATFIPVSDSGPHMAKLGEDRYFKRAGDSFVRMEHFDVADMFGRRPKPVLEFQLFARPDGAQSEQGVDFLTYKIIGAIFNAGRGSAVAPCLSIEVLSQHTVSMFGVDGNGALGLPPLASSGSSTRFGASANVLLHPKTRIDVFAIRSKFKVEDPTITDVVIDYELSASDLPLQSGTARLTADEIARMLRNQ